MFPRILQDKIKKKGAATAVDTQVTPCNSVIKLLIYTYISIMGTSVCVLLVSLSYQCSCCDCTPCA